MQFLKTLFWVALAVAAVLFARANWTLVTINLWGGLVADTKLPVLMALFFLLGFVPLFIFDRTRIWALRRRLEAPDWVANGPVRPRAVPVVSQPAPRPGSEPMPVSNSGAARAPVKNPTAPGEPGALI